MDMRDYIHRDIKRHEAFDLKYRKRLIDAINLLERKDDQAPDILTYLMDERFIYTWVAYNGVQFWKDPAACVNENLNMFNAGSAITLISNKSTVLFMFAVEKNVKSIDDFARNVVTEVYRRKSMRKKFYKAIGGA